MVGACSMPKPGLADVVLAPLTLLERSTVLLKRSRGWRRRGLVLLYLAIALTVGLVGWREFSLWGLPDGPEPFDLAKYGRVEVPDADDAMVAYREVFSRFGDLDARNYKVDSATAWEVSDWSAADPEVRRWAEDHRAALEAWLPANDRPDSLLVQPEEMRIASRIDEAQVLPRPTLAWPSSKAPGLNNRATSPGPGGCTGHRSALAATPGGMAGRSRA